jgi:hypothetical protein
MGLDPFESNGMIGWISKDPFESAALIGTLSKGLLNFI